MESRTHIIDSLINNNLPLDYQIRSMRLTWVGRSLLTGRYCLYEECLIKPAGTVVPTKSDSDAMFCLQSYQGLRIDRSLVY